MAIQDLRFPDRKQVKSMIENCQLAGAVIDMDNRGYFVHSFTMPDWLAAMPTAEQVAATKAEAPAAPAQNKKAPPRNIKNGACEMIRTWARANPAATKVEAQAQFPDLNPSTVAIQLRKVRMGTV